MFNFNIHLLYFQSNFDGYSQELDTNIVTVHMLKEVLDLLQLIFYQIKVLKMQKMVFLRLSILMNEGPRKYQEMFYNDFDLVSSIEEVISFEVDRQVYISPLLRRQWLKKAKPFHK